MKIFLHKLYNDIFVTFTQLSYKILATRDHPYPIEINFFKNFRFTHCYTNQSKNKTILHDTPAQTFELIIIETIIICRS